MSREPESSDLVTISVRCILCQASATIALPAGERMQKALGALTCTTCHRRGGVKLSRPSLMFAPEPVRVGMYEEPKDELGDEELLARRPWRKP